MALHCTASGLLDHFDEGTLRDLLSDNGQPVQGELDNHARLTKLLKAASGRLEAACLLGENYSADELANMSENSKALAAEICSRLVMASLMMRRPGRFAHEYVRELEQSGEDYLQQLRNGARLFDVGDHAEAGKVAIEYPTVAEIHDQNSITQRTKNYYPDPAARLPISRGGA